MVTSTRSIRSIRTRAAAISSASSDSRDSLGVLAVLNSVEAPISGVHPGLLLMPSIFTTTQCALSVYPMCLTPELWEEKRKEREQKKKNQQAGQAPLHQNNPQR